MDKNSVENLLRTVIDRHHGEDLVSAKAVKAIDIDADKLSVRLELGYPAGDYVQALQTQVTQLLTEIAGVGSVEVSVRVSIASHAVQQSLKPHPKIKNIIAIASGKGGVGKSTTVVNLALALSVQGARVGILDADIYGPSIPTMLGLQGLPESVDNKTMQPKVAFGIQTMSIGYLIEADTAVIWRGPMVTNALQQLFKDTQWDNLDYLIIDLPPGTGDIHLTLAQQFPVSGAIIVTTPQDIALLDAQRGLSMFAKVGVPVLGIIENMSLHICTNCGHEEAIFSTGGGAILADTNKVDFLGALPLDRAIREQADSGYPSVIADPQGRSALLYQEIARKAAAKLALRAKDFKGKFAPIVVKNG